MRGHERLGPDTHERVVRHAAGSDRCVLEQLILVQALLLLLFFLFFGRGRDVEFYSLTVFSAGRVILGGAGVEAFDSNGDRGLLLGLLLVRGT